jgi:hypothetical protein
MPDTDGVLYTSQSGASAVAEIIQVFRGNTVDNSDFKLIDGSVYCLVHLFLENSANLIDLTQSSLLAKLGINPPEIATLQRPVTQQLARRLYREGYDGFLWWSNLEASWTNLTLFAGRIKNRLSVVPPIKALSVDLPEVIEAARILRIPLSMASK